MTNVAERPCVWMTAGVVSYKLCDRDFDCEHCPLDLGLRGTSFPSQIELPVRSSDELAFPDDRWYHPAHTWAMPLDRGRVRCGIDAFAASLFGRTTALVLPPSRTRVRQGQVGYWLSETDSLVPLLAPVSGRIVRRNASVRRRPLLVVETPYDRGWLLELDCRQWESERSALIDAAAMEERARDQTISIRRQLSEWAESGSRAVGITMGDGGERITEVRSLLGADRYRRMICSLLS